MPIFVNEDKEIVDEATTPVSIAFKEYERDIFSEEQDSNMQTEDEDSEIVHKIGRVKLRASTVSASFIS